MKNAGTLETKKKSKEQINKHKLDLIMKNILLALSILFIKTSFAQINTSKIDSILINVKKEYPEVGISIGFLDNENISFNHIGTLSKKSDSSVNEHTVFEIASVTKAITGNLIAQAIEDKKFESNSFIDDYLPTDFKLNNNIKHKIKISDLASHQSGLPDIDFRKLIAINPQNPINIIDRDTVLAMVNTCNTLIDYGKYRYSNIGFILLGQILEQVYQKSYDAILREKIINSSQMKRTFTTHFDIKNIASGNNMQGGHQDLFDWNIMAPAGLIKSSSFDMIIYLKQILSNKPIGLAANIAENSFYKDEDIEIGLGVNIIKIGNETIYAKTGDSLGQSSVIAYNRDKKWGLVILINQSNSNLRNNIFNTIYEEILN